MTLTDDELNTVDIAARCLTAEPAETIAFTKEINFHFHSVRGRSLLVVEDTRHPVQWVPQALTDATFLDGATLDLKGQSDTSSPDTKGLGETADPLQAIVRFFTLGSDTWLVGHGLAGVWARRVCGHFQTEFRQLRYVPKICTFGAPRPAPDAVKEIQSIAEGVIVEAAGDPIPNLWSGVTSEDRTLLLGKPNASVGGLQSHHPGTLLEDIGRVQRKLDAAGVSSTQRYFQAAEGLLPGLAAHRVDAYQTAVTRHVHDQQSVIDGAPAALPDGEEASASLKRPDIERIAGGLADPSGPPPDGAPISFSDAPRLTVTGALKAVFSLVGLSWLGFALYVLGTRVLGPVDGGAISLPSLEAVTTFLEIVAGIVAILGTILVALGLRAKKMRISRTRLMSSDFDVEVRSEKNVMASSAGRKIRIVADDEDTQSPSDATTDAPGAKHAAVVLSKRDDWSPPAWVDVLSSYERHHAVLIPPHMFDTLKRLPSVSNAERSRPAETLELVTSVPVVNGRPVDRAGIDELGDRALLGLMDTGIDILHEAFQDDAGACRVLGVWHQADNTGPSPKQVDPSFSADFGTLYTPADIAGFRSGPLEEIPPALRDRLTGRKNHDGHGTHVASIAAGRRTDNTEDGIAPRAGIIVVIPNIVGGPLRAPSIGYSASHVTGLIFLKEASNRSTVLSAEPRPMVVNMSMGMNAGAHDGKTPLEVAIDGLTADGAESGFAVVKSAGNQGRSRTHARITLGAVPRSIEWTVGETDAAQHHYLEGWYYFGQRLRFKLYTPGSTSPIEIGSERVVTGHVGGAAVRLEVQRTSADNADSMMSVYIQRGPLGIPKGTWRLRIEAEKLLNVRTDFDLWLENEPRQDVEMIEPEFEVTLTVPGTADTVISVASCSKEQDPETTGSSSRGPTRIGHKLKPEISAPGEGIIAANGGTDSRNAAIALSGTSMAAPHVSGALLLAQSHLSKHEKVLILNAMRALLFDNVRPGTANYDHESGFGVLDVARFLDAVQTYEHH